MSRVIAGVIAANLAAPILYLFFIILFVAPDFFPGSGNFSGIIVGAVFFAVFITVFPISLIFALLGWFLHWRSMWIYLLGAIAIGMTFALFINEGQLHYPVHQRRFLVAAVIGAICGWIYWLISIQECAFSKEAA